MGFSSAPKIVKTTILATLFLTFFSLMSNAFFTKVLGIPGPQQLLSLSLWGIHHFCLWQFVSYLFVQPVAAGISFGLLLQVFFDLYLLWVIGTSLLHLKGAKHFLWLYLGGGFFVGLVSYLCQLTLGISVPFAGATPAIYILLISWSFLFPTASLMLFMMIPMRAKYLVFGLIGVNLFLDFSNGNFFGFFITAASLLFGYLYAVLAWEMVSPFPRLHKLENKLIHLKRRLLAPFAKKPHEIAGKIYDFQTGEVIVQEEDFVNQCLDKISRYGKQSLTLRERWKLYLISRRKSRSKGHFG